jgi:hypothetical protein
MSDLLDLALKAHGGLARWREVKSLDARVSLTGALCRLKGYPEGVPNVTVRIDTRRRRRSRSAHTRGRTIAVTSHRIEFGSKTVPAKSSTSAEIRALLSPAFSPRIAGCSGDRRPDPS